MGVYPWMYIVAVVLGLIGFQQFISGATHRPYAQVTCRVCRTTVVGKKTMFGIQCPTGKHPAVVHVGMLVLFGTLVFMAVLIAMIKG